LKKSPIYNKIRLFWGLRKALTVAEIGSGNGVISDSKTRATLLARLQDASDALAWDEFFQRYWRLIYAYARRCNCSEHTAEEIVQDVMLRVFRQKDVFCYDPARGRFRDWLSAVVRNRVAELRRRPSERVRAVGGDSDINHIEPQADVAQPEAIWENAFEEALLLLLLDVVRREMSPRAYLAFELFTLQEMPGAKVAKHTGLTRNGVYRAHKRAIQRLRELGAEYREEGQLSQRIKQALRSRPRPAIEQSLTTRVERVMLSR
jgi:RNA polymerase sigma factor (sigma-70 family)